MTNALAMRRGSQPGLFVGPENPKPGREGMITWKAGMLLALGFVNGSINVRNSTMEPGHPYYTLSIFLQFFVI